jgi:hypothetical protein
MKGSWMKNVKSKSYYQKVRQDGVKKLDSRKSVASKNKVKYLIIISSYGLVYGSFFPTTSGRRAAKAYLTKLRNQEATTKFSLHEVCNLNKFLASIKTYASE